MDRVLLQNTIEKNRRMFAGIDRGLMDASRFDAALDRCFEWRQRPDAALWYGVCWAEGMRPTD